MVSTPRVSVIVPVYNAEKTIARCLESILAQTVPDLEVVVVDDGSPDGSAAIAASFAEEDERIRVLHQPNAGLGAARNTGVQAAQGAYLSFVDSDDFIEPHMLEAMLTAAEATGARVVNAETFVDVFNESGSLTNSSVLSLPLEGSTATGFEAFRVFSVLVPPVLNSVCFKLIHRSFFQESAVTFPEAHRFAEDMPVTARVFLESPVVTLIHEPLYHYVRSSSVITSSFSLKKALDLILDMEEICASAEAAAYPGSLDPFKLEMLFSVIRQVTWSGEANSVEGKALLSQVASLRPEGRLDMDGIAAPLMQRVKMHSVTSGSAALLCKLAYGLRWIPAVKHLM